MADKKKRASRSQSASARTRSREKNQPVKSSKATVDDEEKMPTQQTSQVNKPAKSISITTRAGLKVLAKPAKQESKPPVRRGASELSIIARFRSTRIGRFVFDAYYELRHKVTWPTFIEARNMTFIVIALSVVIGGLLALADLGLLQLFKLISGGR